MVTIFVSVSVAMALLAISFFLGSLYHKGEVARDMEDLAYLKKTYLSKSGASAMIENANSYSLRSLDSGKNWYAVEITDGNEVLVIGTAEEVFPGLLAHLAGLDALVEYVEQNGPVFSGGRLSNDISIMEAAGFEVEVGETPGVTHKSR